MWPYPKRSLLAFRGFLIFIGINDVVVFGLITLFFPALLENPNMPSVKTLYFPGIAVDSLAMRISCHHSIMLGVIRMAAGYLGPSNPPLAVLACISFASDLFMIIHEGLVKKTDIPDFSSLAFGFLLFIFVTYSCLLSNSSSAASAEEPAFLHEDADEESDE